MLECYFFKLLYRTNYSKMIAYKANCSKYTKACISNMLGTD